jgi:hypothetical protein
MKEAHDRLQHQEAREEQQRLQKAKAARLREESRQAKVKDIEIRRQARAEARILRGKEKAENAAQKASRAAAHGTERLQKALKAIQKGKRIKPKAAAESAQKKTFSVEPQGCKKALGAAAGAQPIQS